MSDANERLAAMQGVQANLATLQAGLEKAGTDAAEKVRIAGRVQTLKNAGLTSGQATFAAHLNLPGQEAATSQPVRYPGLTAGQAQFAAGLKLPT